MPEFNSTRFGTVVYNEETTLQFPNGLLQAVEGFENCTNFHLFHEEEGSRILHYLQSLDDPDLSFTLLDPSYLNIDYEITLNDEEGALLGDFGDEEPVIMLMVYRPLKVEDDAVTQDSEIKAQTQSPLIINPKSRKGIQKVGLTGRLVFTNVSTEE
jgi:flagellar assembly factor FliW